MQATTLNELINMCINDPSNTLYSDGTRRFDREIEWIRSMFESYSKALGVPVDTLVEREEKYRNMWWPNYYQPCHYPPVDSESIVGRFENVESFRSYTQQHWKGFRCPKCGTIGDDPQNCVHRLANDGECDWAAYGLFGPGHYVVIESNGIRAIPIFEPIKKINTEAISNKEELF